ncbi:MAG: FtsX-like permease family protein [Bacteroidetes bacterium]|nr:MAG: FtsX-like permease family protein [Bacteroidota bacterium]
MIKNYFKTAWRNLARSKVFSTINIVGLSIGLACCLLMFLFIQNELSYDKYNVHAKNIYRLTSEAEGPNGITSLAVSPAPWAPTMKKDYAEIRNYTRLLKAEKTDIGQPGRQHFYETDLLYADSTFLDVFSVQLEKGDRNTALKQPNSIILTSETARKYFGDEDPIGKTLEVNSFVGRVTVQVTAIARKLPANSSFTFNSVVSLQTIGDLSNFWAFHMFHSYLLLNDNSSAADLEKKFPAFVNKYIINNPQADGNQDIHLQPLTSIHLHSNMVGELRINGDITYIYVFAGVALFVLLIACFNFTNLSTARSLTRAKEVGLRKVVGAEKRQLLSQFLGETTLFALISMVLAVLITLLVLPFFNQLSERDLHIDFAKNYELVFVLILLVMAVGLLAGLYPATVLSAFKPVEVLKGRLLQSSQGVSFRKLLVTLQFVVSITLIASTVLVTRQLHFLQNKKLGFDKENVLIVTLPKDMDSTRLVSFKSSLLRESSILSVAGSEVVPGLNIPVNQVNDGSADLSKTYSMQMLSIDEDFVKAMKMKLLAGRNLAADHPTDKVEGFILNEEAVKKMGWKDPVAAIGKTMQWVRPDVVLKRGKVLGVVENFNITPLKTAVQPLVMHYAPLRFQYLFVRFNQRRAQQLTSLVENKFHEYYPKQSFEYNFLDDNLNRMYKSERRLGNIFGWFSFLAILIASMGMLGLSLYSIQQRVKEIGIRKVLGASVLGITKGLLKEFIKPVIVAAIIATPVAWYMMNKWLNDFAYRIHISVWIFIVAGALAMLIAALTVSIQAIRAAIANPVKSLRTE